MDSTELFDASFLARYSGPQPPVMSTRLAIDPQTMMLIGLNIAQWGSLCETLSFYCRFWSGFPDIPESIRVEKIRSDTKSKIAYLKRISAFAFNGKRENAEIFLTNNFNRIYSSKQMRDALAHGTFEESNNRKKDQVTVLYKRMRYTYTHAQLLRNGRDIGEADCFFGEFTHWIRYAEHITIFEKLRELHR